jgi:hypothetical protein
VHALLATGVNAADCREILGLHVTTSEDGADWLAFFRDRERGAHREAELADAEADLARTRLARPGRRPLTTASTAGYWIAGRQPSAGGVTGGVGTSRPLASAQRSSS